MSRFAETEEKARVYILAMEDYENEKLLNSPFREPLSKKNYTNLIEAEATIKKLDRQFRKITKFNSRKYMDPLNHTRREERMLKRANDRWDGAYTLFTNELTE